MTSLKAIRRKLNRAMVLLQEISEAMEKHTLAPIPAPHPGSYNMRGARVPGLLAKSVLKEENPTLGTLYFLEYGELTRIANKTKLTRERVRQIARKTYPGIQIKKNGPTLYTGTCKHCSKAFQTVSPGQKYCSQSCGGKASALRRKWGQHNEQTQRAIDLLRSRPLKYGDLKELSEELGISTERLASIKCKFCKDLGPIRASQEDIKKIQEARRKAQEKKKTTKESTAHH